MSRNYVRRIFTYVLLLSLMDLVLPRKNSADSRERNCGIQGAIQNSTIKPIALTRQRIVGGTEAAEGSQPWTVALLYKGRFFCGGSLLQPRIVITAGHCVQMFNGNPNNLEISYGNLQWTKGTRVAVVKTAIHPLFQTTPRPAYDIALLKLKKPVQSEQNLFICLPDTPPRVGETCVASGWGRIGENGDLSPTLQEVTLVVQSNTLCNDSKHYNGLVHPSMVCAGYDEGRKDACQGDSGGPLICKRNNTWDLQGVVSWGSGCARENSPGVFTRVLSSKPWILRTITSL